jgi:opacity protein-like surface antigen
MKKILFVLFIALSIATQAQNDRVHDDNNINWVQTFNTIHLNKKWSLHAEYQWRRTNGFKSWQQSLLRIGANYKLHENITLHAGYGWIETFPYGDFPIASAGTFPEHRFYEQITFRQPISRFTFSHRFRIEQRWLGRVTTANGNRNIENWFFLHRFRYQFRAMYSLGNRNNNQPYMVAADELFIGAGKNLGTNIFDQNRIFLLLGYKFIDKLSIEGGYFNQALQQGKRINNTTIIQRNNGIVLGSYLNL